MKRARPQGLGAAAKKAALESEGSPKAVEAQEAPQTDKSSKLVFELPEDATAFDQVKALYETAIVSLEDTEKALPIFNGVVHECIRLEKIKESEEEPSDLHPDDNDIDSYIQVKRDAEKIFRSEFYFILGDSLRNIAELSMSDINAESFENVKGLFLAAKDKLDTALSQGPEDNFSESLAESIFRCDTFIAILEGNGEVTVTEKSIECVCEAFEFLSSVVEFLYENSQESASEVQKIATDALRLLVCQDEFKPRINLLGLDQEFRFMLAKEGEFDNDKVSELIAKLEDIIKVSVDSDLKYEAFMLKGSIYEATGNEVEAEKAYSEAECIIDEEN